MAETRTFDGNASEGIQKLVREALGETVRPVEPGSSTPNGDGAVPADPGPAAGDLGDTVTLDFLSYDPNAS